jgi:hypothetical protein
MMNESKEYLQVVDELERAEQRAAALEEAMRAAIDELRRWQDSDDPNEVRHSIDMAIRTLETA